MTTIFSSNFTAADGTLVQDLVPDVGTSFTRLWGTTNTNAEINSNRCRSDGDTNSGVIYTCDATYSSADYDITFTDVGLVNLTGRPVYARKPRTLARYIKKYRVRGRRLDRLSTNPPMARCVS